MWIVACKWSNAMIGGNDKHPEKPHFSGVFKWYGYHMNEDAAVLVLPPGSKAAIVERRYLCRKITRITTMQLHDGVERDLTNLYD